MVAAPRTPCNRLVVARAKDDEEADWDKEVGRAARQAQRTPLVQRMPRLAGAWHTMADDDTDGEAVHHRVATYCR